MDLDCIQETWNPFENAIITGIDEIILIVLFIKENKTNHTKNHLLNNLIHKNACSRTKNQKIT